MSYINYDSSFLLAFSWTTKYFPFSCWLVKCCVSKSYYSFKMLLHYIPKGLGMVDDSQILALVRDSQQFTLETQCSYYFLLERQPMFSTFSTLKINYLKKLQSKTKFEI